MNPEIEIKLELIPVVQKDESAGCFVAHFEQFPRAIGYGESSDQAKADLIESFSAMWNDKSADITQDIIRKYLDGELRKFQKVKELKVTA